MTPNRFTRSQDAKTHTLLRLLSVLVLALGGCALWMGGGAIAGPVGPQVFAGGSATCAVAPSGESYCWGKTSGNGAVGRVLGPDGEPARLRSLHPGIFRTCGLDWRGSVVCNPSDVSSVDTFYDAPMMQAVAGGYYHGCALDAAGQALCWGSNSMGQLGRGTWSDNRGSLGDELEPAPVIGGHRFAALSAGETHTCALTDEGVAYCWGYGQSGQVGNRDIMTYCSGALPQPNMLCSQADPFRVTSDVRFREINAGMRMTCAVSVEDDAYCWGSGYRCALARCYDDSHTPLRIPVPSKVRTVDAGYWFGCALTVDARAFCWGNNDAGQLGSTATIPNCFQNSRCTPEPTEVSGGHRWLAISAGESHACGVTTERDVLCWGNKAEGRLGEEVDPLGCDLPSRAWPDDPCAYWPRPVKGLPRLR